MPGWQVGASFRWDGLGCPVEEVACERRPECPEDAGHSVHGGQREKLGNSLMAGLTLGH